MRSVDNTKQIKKDNKVYYKELKEAKKTKRIFDYSEDINFKDVSYTYSKNTPFEFRALDHTNVILKKGKITCIIGTTGSGKSTLIQLTNGLLVTETGVAMIGNYPIPAGVKRIINVKQLRKQMGLVFQFPEYQLFQDTVEKDVAFGPINLGDNKTEVIKEVPKWIELVGLSKEYLSRSPFELSGGQKRRVAIAGILAMNGNTLVLDEPTGGLDPQGEEDFMNLFLKLNKEKNKRIIMVTHNMDQVLKIADEVIVMNKGKLIAKDTPFKIFSDKKLLDDMEIEPPKIYSLIHKLEERGMNFEDHKIRTVEDLAARIKEIKENRK